MKIVHITHSCSRSAGGLFESVRGMLKAQLRSGHSVEVFCLSDEYLTEDIDVWPEGAVRHFENLGGTRYGFSIDLIQGLRSSQADVFHLHGIWNFAAAACRIGVGVRPLIVSPRGMLDEWILGRSVIQKRISSRIFERSLIENSFVHALNSSEASSILKYAPSASVFVSPNAINLPLHIARPKIAKVAPFIFCFLGRLHSKKGILELIQATEIVRRNCTRAFTLEIYGWGDIQYIDELKSVVKGLQLDDLVKFQGPVYETRKEEAFRNANAFVLPSYSEGLPMAVLEAASYGLPSLISEQCNLPEFFLAGAATKCSQSPESIAQGMINMLSCDDLFLMGENAKAVVSKSFTWTAVTPTIIEAYATQIEKSSKMLHSQ
ncbi:MAG: glycosyltransferase [Thiobacillus sp.]|nr:glycosyltransferase [Thiobacillus sp.]